MRHGARKIVGAILAAGYGERMLPLTAEIPKPLLPVLGTPLLEILVGKLLRQSAGEIHVNLFHLPGRIERLAAGRGWPVQFHRERELFGTGGGIGNMADELSSADIVLLHNGDVLSNIQYEPAIELHEARRALVTLVLVPSGPAANVAIDGRGGVTGVGDEAVKNARASSLLGYTGLAVLSPESLTFFPRGKRAGLVPILNEMIRAKPG
ncbi:MAG TPA: sugar phosphate nucleotidyltransferase, partial [Candidatus Bathyarchaeia archaeon]|nr:sugar phosphate nucleotidyltransferase [Candidatus Bathyarchaeia archaeon]